MAEIAEKRGFQTVLGIAESLSFKKQGFDLVLIVAALSLFEDPVQHSVKLQESLNQAGKLS